MDMPYVSVFMPVYNVEKYLGRAIESVLCQTYPNFELILVDDGSTDESGKICDYYASKDNRIVVVHQDNKGLAETCNVGYALTRYEYVFSVDSDDYIESNMIEVMLEKALISGADICICNYFGEYGDNIFEGYSISSDVKMSKEQAIENLLKLSIKCFRWNKMFKSDCIRNVEFPAGRMYEDMFTALEIFNNAEKAIQIKDALYHYVVRGGSITSITNSEKKAKDIFDAYLTQLSFTKEHYPQYLNLCYKNCISQCITTLEADMHNKLYNNLVDAFVSENIGGILKCEKLEIGFKIKTVGLKYFRIALIWILRLRRSQK